MSDGCSSPALEAGAAVCLACGQPGAPVQRQTVKALLRESALRRLAPTHYRFCAHPECDVVYFGDAGDVFLARDLRVPVWQKEPCGARLLCYCFGETEGNIRTEILEVGRSEVVARIREHISAERCACDIRNPRGACCLGDVIAALKQIESVGCATEEVQ